MADVNPAVDGIESTKWSDNACAAFLNISKIDYADDNLIAFIHKVDGDTHKIVLYNRSSRTEICLNSKLVSQGYATTMDPIACVFKKTNIRKQVKKPVLLNSRNASRTFFENYDLNKLFSYFLVYFLFTRTFYRVNSAALTFIKHILLGLLV